MLPYFSIFSFAGSLVSASFLPVRAATTVDSKTVFAYGSTPGPGIGGIPLIYTDGIAYIGKQAPSNASVAANMTFTWDSTTSPIDIASNSSNVTFSSDKHFYIDTASDAYNSVQVTSDAPSDNYTDTGFMFYGTSLFWKSSSGALLSEFYATPTGEDGIWILKWNAKDADDGTSVPVSLKTTPPNYSTSRL